MWIEDPKTKEKSVTLTLYVFGFIVSTFKMLTSGMTIATLHLGTFSGSDFAIAVGALGSIYVARKVTDNKNTQKE